jgi:hypothetical protein
MKHEKSTHARSAVEGGHFAQQIRSPEEEVFELVVKEKWGSDARGRSRRNPGRAAAPAATE